MNFLPTSHGFQSIWKSFFFFFNAELYVNGNCMFVGWKFSGERESEKRVSGKGKRILDLHQSTFMSNFTLFIPAQLPLPLFPAPASVRIFFFSSQTVHIDCDTNMEMVLPANYSIVVSCALNLSDCLLSPQTRVAPRNHMDIKFYYHKGSTCRQHKI